MSNRSVQVIDLTDSFTLADHCALSNIVIELDDSMNDESNTRVSLRTTVEYQPESSGSVSDVRVSSDSTRLSTRRKKPSTLKRKEQTQSLKRENRQRMGNLMKFGDCPICFDELGTNPLASTKCGHVFCLRCLEDCLHVEKKCPTCRRALKGSSGYHPLYLARG